MRHEVWFPNMVSGFQPLLEIQSVEGAFKTKDYGVCVENLRQQARKLQATLDGFNPKL